MVKKFEKIKKSKARTTTHVCSECLNDFNSKEVFLALASTGDHKTIYCKKCLDKLKIKEYFTYSGVLVDETKPLKVVKKTIKKATTKKGIKKIEK